MKILITGRHVGVTEAMKTYARAKAEKLTHLWDRATSCRVTMNIDHDDHEVEMVLQVNRGVTLVGKASAPDMYAACDLAEQKLAQQLRKYKERLTDHHRGRRQKGADRTRPEKRAVKSSGEATYEDVIEEMRRGD
ncbi:MAG: ribosome-associated translation inhibitor RaiA [Planctomycetota bacterium]|nr:ribosome-associated translation inhibitor RaiA [Planctomycetota bacterium]